jgi:hypothetical protein
MFNWQKDLHLHIEGNALGSMLSGIWVDSAHVIRCSRTLQEVSSERCTSVYSQSVSATSRYNTTYVEYTIYDVGTCEISMTAPQRPFVTLDSRLIAALLKLVS